MRNQYVPMVIEQSGHVERAYDIYSRLLKDRIVFIGMSVDDFMANIIIAQLLYLQMEDRAKDINIYINTPGGSITAGMAIYDTIRFMQCDVATYCVGQAASMGAVLLCAGTKGKRYSLPNARIMIHQPWGGFQGAASDIAIQAEEVIKTRSRLNELLARDTGRPLPDIERDTDRDKFFSSEEAKEYGLIDGITMRTEAKETQR